MSAMASQITSLAVVYSTVYSDADQRKHQSSRHWPCEGNSPVTSEFPARKCFHLMTSSWENRCQCSRDVWRSFSPMFSQQTLRDLLMRSEGERYPFECHQTSKISRSKSQHMNVSRPAAVFVRSIQVLSKQGKSEGFDSCDPPSNLTQNWFKSSIFLPVWPWNLMDGPKKQFGTSSMLL